MWPTIISWGPIRIHSFGIMLFLGLFFGVFKLWQKTKEEGWDEVKVFDAWFLSGIFGIILGRIGFGLLQPEIFAGSWYKILWLTQYPGLSGETVWWGMLVALIVLALLKKIDFWHFTGILIPAALIVEIFIRLGTFLGGTNLGKLAPAGWGLVFPGVDGGRWPVQLFWTAALILVYIVINVLEKNYRRLFPWAKDGFLLAIYCLLSGGLRLGLGRIELEAVFWWGGAQVAAGILILLLRSGITIKAPVFNRRGVKNKTKKHGFDYV